MEQIFSRFAMLVGEEGIDKLNNSSVIVFGIGGVGSYVVESLVRSGIGKITMVDFDEISESNINRQIHALKSTVGKSKIEVMKERILDINPECEVILKKKLVFENVPEIFEEDGEKYDFAVSRAVAELRILVEYLLPLVKVGGKVIAMKGPNIDEEVENAKKAIKLLGGEIERIESFRLGNTDNERTVIIIKKIKNTELKYPRKAGIPRKNPL